MHSTHGPLTVATAQQMAAPVIEMLLQPREVTLKREAPKSTYCHQVRRNVACRNATPIEMLLAVSVPDADDPRVALGEVEAPYLAIIELLRARRRERLGDHPMLAPRSLLPFARRENRCEHAENDSAFVLLADENNLDSLEIWLHSSMRERAAQEEMEQAVRERIALLRAAGATVAA